MSLKIPLRLYKKAVSRGLRRDEEAAFGELSEDEKQEVLGCFGKKIKEALPQWIATESEYILGGYKEGMNSWIVMGRDRVDNRMTGKGGACHTQAWSIDLVAGLMGHKVVMGHDGKYTNPSPPEDAARVYISQKSDPDKNYGLATGFQGYIWDKSAIVAKADAVRVIARENIKIVTMGEGKNSQGGDIVSRGGVDIIAGNDDRDLQPMVKGDHLSAALERLAEILGESASQTYNTILSQTKLNVTLMSHTHISWPTKTLPDPLVMYKAPAVVSEHIFQAAIGTIITQINLMMWTTNYLKPWGGKYINSRWNNVN
jgi:hypothetical protein